ncbi:alpha/beta fold hydrolase [Nocardioides sp. cx-169]|uniref:alpha/beta hydrolase family protein n=1 Tax=Nocardioides sp. cx-169 TaxID=2899080 RepID=UPI001E4FCFE4|nr:alpha/beta fold hydrolase [Nocardioides sp. cx-169]MCD4536259.1 alpha/beta fold hydrolase [Nocardioides sp. cx-169]
MTSRLALPLATALLTAGLSAAPATSAAPAPAAPPTAAGKVTVTHGCLRSAPETRGGAPVKICYSVFKPPRATAKRRVPMLMHSHGWGGSRTKDPAALAAFTRAGYGVISFDQRGWGESGGKAHVESPAYEGKDVRALVRLVSRLRWVRQDGRGDPRLGAIGGSYGGGYQLLGAFESLRLRGKPVFDALAPEITWHDLSQSLAPEGVTRTEWALGLSAAALPSQALPERVYQALIEGAATGQWPDGSLPGGQDLVSFFERNGPKWHADHGRRLDIPVLLGQGTTDTLFPLQQGLANWQRGLTKRARKHSIFVGYNGGHVLPNLLPAGIDVTSDPCSRRLAGGDFRALSIRFFDARLKGRKTGLRGWGRIHLATPSSTCTTVRSVAPTRRYAVGTVATTVGPAGAPVAVPVVKGPVRVAGSPYLTGKVTALGLENRAFYGLAVGTSPATARLVQNNVLPLREVSPVTGVARRVTLPSVAVNVPAGQTLYLLATAVSDTFVTMGSRTPGVVIIDDTVVSLPVVRR